MALVVIGHFKPEWNALTGEEQAAFATQVGRLARKLGITPVVGYKLNTPGAFLEIWEAADKATLDRFRQQVNTLGAGDYYGEVVMWGERSEGWIAPNGEAREADTKERKA